MVLYGCSRKETLPQAADTLAIPCQEVTSSTLYGYGSGKLIWKLDSDYSFKTLDDTSSMLVVPVRMTIYDTSGTGTTKVLADSGRTNKDLERFFVWSNVYIKNYDGQIIQSQSLWWDKASRKVGSDDFVEIRTPGGDVLRGKGLDANETFSNWSLRRQVSGEFPNFKSRMASDADF
jgi:LPS export ABC transporter protein LptC